MKVNSFIKQSKRVFNDLNNRLKIVIGNQSADLDSIVSSISLAFYLSSNTETPTFIPIINSSKSIIATKKPCTYLFDQMSVDLDDLIFIGEVKRDRLDQVILVDHNELDQREKDDLKLESLVRGVVDHHIDRGGFSNAPLRLINTGVGSNTSQIANMFAQSNRRIEPSFADLMLYPILFDTSNLTQQTHQPDIDAVAYLKKSASVDQNKLYAKLDELKFARDENENVFDLLRQDYKMYDGKWAMSSVTFSIADWIQKESNLAESIEFMKQNELLFYGILSIFRDSNSGEHRRDLIVFGDDSVIRKLVDLKEESISLLKVQSSSTPSYVLFNVNQIKFTRKYWQPFLHQFLKDQNLI